MEGYLLGGLYPAMDGYLLGGLCGAGITGNLLTLVVLQRDNDKKNSTNWLLQAHAVFDSLYLLTRLLTGSCPSYINVLEITTGTVKLLLLLPLLLLLLLQARKGTLYRILVQNISLAPGIGNLTDASPSSSVPVPGLSSGGMAAGRR